VIGRVVRLALSFRGVVLGLALALVAAGLAAFEMLDIEAYPNPVPPLVEVIVQPQGWSAEEVERYVTIPLEVELSGMPGLDHIRSQSLFGLADVKAYFRWGVSYQEARQEVVNRLQFVQLPAGLQAQLSPWNAIGEVFRYRVKGKGYTLAELKTAADWILEREFRQVPGVIDVTSFGGETKQYHVDVDPNLLRSYGVNLAQLQQALANANLNTGGQRITEGEQSYTVRGIGVIRSTKDVGDVVVAIQKGTPVRVRDVGTVTIGAAPRLGQVGLDHEPEIVEGIVLMRYGERTKPTLKGIHQRLGEIRKKKVLPPGMEIEPIYDRGALVALTTRTVMENLLFGILLVSAVLVVFLGNWKAALVTAMNIPLSLLAAFIGMVATGTPANLISLGAVDFGIVVDSTVIMVENVYRHLGSHGTGTMVHRILAAAAEVGRPMAFSTLVIGVAFLPLFTMTGVSGVIFSPMAHTYAFAIGGAFILAITLTPVVLSRALKARDEDKESRVMQLLHHVYTPVIRAAIRKPGLAVSAALVPVLAGLALFHFVGAEFMPKLEEGNFWIRATLPTSISLEQSTKYVGRMRDIVKGHPEVAAVVSQLGRPDDGTDVSGFNNIELFAPLKPFGDWKRGLTKEALTRTLSGELSDAFPGVVFNFSQMIGDNVEEALSGVKGENTVKVVGPDIKVNQELGDQISDLMEGIRGVHDLGMFRSLGQPSVKVSTDRVRAARFGLNTGDVEAVVQAAVGGQAVTQVYEGEKHFDVVVRLQEPYRNSAAAIRRIPLFTPDGTQVALGDVADVVEEDGPSVVFREDGRRYTPVKFSVRGRDLSSTIREAQARIEQKIKLPWDTHLEWAGQINELADAVRRLALIIPITFLAMGLLVHLAVRNTRDVVVVLMSILVACAGGVVALALSGIHFSVSAAMGFISIFGIAIQGAIIVVNYAQQQWAEGFDLAEGARIAAEKRLRPVLMTTIVATLGLLPAALSNDIGAQTQKPLAVVVIGGSLALAVFTPVLQPAMLVVFHRRSFRGAPPTPPRARKAAA